MIDQEIFDLIDRFDRSTLRTLKLSAQGFSLELGRDGAAAAPAASAAASLETPAPAPAKAPETADTSDTAVITAPLVGTFYAAPAPDQPPLVAVGDRVTAGQTLCLIEAMKMMSEIAAPCDCVITEVLKASGDLAAFGDPLFRYKPC